MDYSLIDAILDDWAKRHGLYVQKEFKGEEGRSPLIVDDSGDEYGVGVWQPDESDRWKVVAAGHGERTQYTEVTVDLGDLSEALESIYREVEGWIAESGNTRTPVL